jgi:hypothetical protein
MIAPSLIPVIIASSVSIHTKRLEDISILYLQLGYLAFKKYEPQNRAIIIFLLVVVPGALSGLTHSNFSTFPAAALATSITYWLLMLMFTVAYRLSPFHPLAKYPGPLWCKISKGWLAYLVFKRGRAHMYVHELHKHYNSDVVRIGKLTPHFIHSIRF